ncbi:NADPH-dependent FMN reductase [Planococcus liqunii]|uniref:NADPH-dependent FMN reductase n=1 Tax=Planococcus liqunii TaxID=3058394 RepID=UPI0026258B59|nr:NADPH-dependent FMN reductase [Planococcus sp. N056]WKA51331.1 NADPH-dependent FMN reductase [Planococcus sp. N056]
MAIKVAAIIGSVREGSMNLRLVEFMKERYADRLDIEAVTINNIPLFNPDIEENVPQEVVNFRHKVKGADAVLFAVPEYNYSIPGSLKNAIDWLSRGGFVLREKPAFIVGSSMGVLGSVRAQIHLREVLSNPSLSPMLLPGNEVYIGSVHEKLNENNEIIDSGTLGFLDQVVDNFVTFYNKMA